MAFHKKMAEVAMVGSNPRKERKEKVHQREERTMQLKKDRNARVRWLCNKREKCPRGAGSGKEYRPYNIRCGKGKEVAFEHKRTFEPLHYL